MLNERTLSMAKKKKTQTAARVKDSTKYYRATYINEDGTGEENEVFISDNLETATRHARETYAHGRILESVQEYEELIEALLY